MNYIYDIEIFPNYFLVSFIDINTKGVDEYIKADINNDLVAKKKALAKINPKVFSIFEEVNDLKALINFLNDKNTVILIGFNNFNYDDVILDFILDNKIDIPKNYKDEVSLSRYITYQLKDLSDQIVGTGWGTRKELDIPYSKQYISIDLMKLNYLDKRKVSLKQTMIALKWYRVEDYTMPEVTEEEKQLFYKDGFLPKHDFNRYVIVEHLSGIFDYNINDCLGTLALYKHSKKELSNRIDVSKLYGVNVLSLSRSATADKLLSKFYSEATGLTYWEFKDKRTYRKFVKFIDILDPNIQFESKELQQFLNNLKKRVFRVGTDSFKEVIIFKGTGYTFATGGLHSVDRGEFYNNSRYNVIDADVGSFYPNAMINLFVVPRHLKSVFISIVQRLTEKRLKAKREGNKSEADILKIVINAIYGKLGYEYGWLYDHQAMFKVTINGQLYLMNLIERLELNGIHVISANTDGIVSTVKDEQLDLYYSICKKWQLKFNFKLDFTKYKKYVRTTVNDYITVKEDGDIKQKGDFVTKLQIDKGYYAPAIAKTLYEYYVNDNTNINEVIKSFDIYDYCISIKVGSQFKTKLHSIKQGKLNSIYLQKDNRYFISKSGGVLKKHRVDDEKKYINVIKGFYVTIFNKYYESDDYNINYSWYTSKVRDMINKINNVVTKGMKTQSGKLFDELF